MISAAAAWDLGAETARIEHTWQEVREQILAGVQPHLAGPMRYALETRGKRVRPVLCCAAYESVQGSIPEGVRRLACSLELIHTYSLVHDDLPCMDDDDLRRGRPTTHRVWGVPGAVLAGAALIPAAMWVVFDAAGELSLSARDAGRLVTELAGAAGAGGMAGGQWRDLEAEAAPVDAIGLERIHRSKTGALLVASLRIGALAGRASPGQLAALSSYGGHLGLAFQIVDDLLDVDGDASATGKTSGRDQALGKSTYPGLFGIIRARAMAEAHLAAALRDLEEARIATPALAILARHVVERRA